MTEAANLPTTPNKNKKMAEYKISDGGFINDQSQYQPQSSQIGIRSVKNSSTIPDIEKKKM
jgi:hypothetical protein